MDFHAIAGENPIVPLKEVTISRLEDGSTAILRDKSTYPSSNSPTGTAPTVEIQRQKIGVEPKSVKIRYP